MGIAFGSINTGLPKDIVQQIVNAEKIPIKNMETQKEKQVEKKGLVEQLGKLVSDVQGVLAVNANARALRELKVDTDNSIITAETDKNVAMPGTYQLEVIQLAQKSSAMSSGFADPDDSSVGVGFIQYTLPNGENKSIYVDSGNSSLNAIAKLINKNPEYGVTATVVNDGSGSDVPWRLVLSLQDTGDEKLAEFPYLYFVDGDEDFYLEFEREAHDAKVKLDGFELEFPGNKIKDLIPGVTIDLKKAKPGEEFPINIKEDVEAVTQKITTIIDKLNEVLKFIKTQNAMDEKTDSSRTLGGDIMLQTLESRIHRAVFSDIATATGFHRINEVGVTFKRDGLLEFDAKKFNAAISKNYTHVAQILTGHINEEGEKTKGFLDNINDLVTSATRMPDGVVSSRKRTIQSTIDQIDRRISDKQRLIDEKEKLLKDKFARLESTISKIKTQGAGVAGLAGSAENVAPQLG